MVERTVDAAESRSSRLPASPTSIASAKGAKIDLAAIMIDGLAFGDECVVLIALGIDRVGKKHVLGLHEGVTENAATCGALLDDVTARGASTNRSKLFVVDGAKALVKVWRASSSSSSVGICALPTNVIVSRLRANGLDGAQ